MNKKYLFGLHILSLILIIVALFIVGSTNALPNSVPTDKAEKRISEIQNGPNLIRKELLLDCYKKHLNFENKLRERDLAYVELVKILSIAVIFIALIQLFLVYKLQKENQSMTSQLT